MGVVVELKPKRYFSVAEEIEKLCASGAVPAEADAGLGMQVMN